MTVKGLLGISRHQAPAVDDIGARLGSCVEDVIGAILILNDISLSLSSAIWGQNCAGHFALPAVLASTTKPTSSPVFTVGDSRPWRKV